MENNLNQNVKPKSGINIRDILLVFKRRIVLMIAVVLIFVAGGTAYSFFQQPEYTVTQKLVYQCENLTYLNSKGEEVKANTTTSNINTMVAYGDTIMDLFDEGVVVDRANYYYKKYLEVKNAENIAVSDFILRLRESDDYTSAAAKSNQSYIDKDSVSAKSLAEKNDTNFAFAVSYTSPNKQEAEDKIALLVFAFEKECAATMLDKNGQSKVKYFGEFEVVVSNLGVESVTNNVSKVKTILVSVLLGVVAAIIFVWITVLLDITVKTKEDLEKLTESPVIACVSSEVE